MNFAAFSPVSAAGTHYVTAGGQVTKLQQNVSNNGTMSQVVGVMGSEGMQYLRMQDGSALHATPQLISVPIALPGTKPGDPQPTVQIQVLGPNLSLQPQQQPKYQMQIPIQGFQQGALLTVAYSPDGNESNGLQLVGQNSLAEAGLQVLAAIPQEMQLQMQHSQAQQDTKGHNIQHQQVYITPDQHIIINGPENSKVLNNNNNEAVANIIIKEECDEIMHDDESQESIELKETVPWHASTNPDIVKYLGQLPPQQLQALPVSLQQFLRLNPTDLKKAEEVVEPTQVEIKDEAITEAVIDEDGNLHIQPGKKKKKYKKKPPKPARPKPGQVIIANAADGTPIFCCPECQMAYPEKEQLEMHLTVHKAERRFICGICGAGLKRKEHLERHKLGHNPERPYVCGVCRKGFKRREHLNLHTVIHSGVKTEMCTQCGKGFYRKDHLRKHTRSHETKRARDEAAEPSEPKPIQAATNNALLPEITIHVPTSANMQVPVQINIPQHVVSSLAAAQQAQQAQDDHGLEALLANHS